MIVVSVIDEGHRKILSLMLGVSETESSWRDFFAWLKHHGLSGALCRF